MLSAFVGGVTLLIQFILDFDQSLRNVEKRLDMHNESMDDLLQSTFKKITEATQTYSTIEASPVGPDIRQLVQSAAELTDSSPDVVLRLAKSEVSRIARLVRELGDGRANYEGEDQDWLLTLTREARQSIDATSTIAVDGNGANFDDGFWTTGLGRRYLGAQRDAAGRGVTVRRLFILATPGMASDPDFQRISQMQIEAHVTIRLLASSMIPSRLRPSQFDVILFDGLVSYEAIAATRFPGDQPNIEKTLLIADPDHVTSRSRLFEELWNKGSAVEGVAAP